MEAEVFVSSPFEPPLEFERVYEAIADAARARKLTACRVDKVRGPEPIIDRIERLIRQSRVVVADITGNNPNVLHEVGLAQSLGKPLVLISQDKPKKAPFNIRSLDIHRYLADDAAGLINYMKGALADTTSPNETLRAMLVPGSLGHPTDKSRFVIAASPLSYRRAMGKRGGFPKLRRTASDYVGLRGILQAFGLLYEFGTLPEIADPDDYGDDVIEESMNLYCIASPKANPWTSVLLAKHSEKWSPRLGFQADSVSADLKNIRVSIRAEDAPLRPDHWKENTHGDRYYRDFGLIVRGPNPYDKDHMMVILAGRSSLGTEAACVAFLDPAKISEIRGLLETKHIAVDIEDHRQAFWALVSMSRQQGDDKEEAMLESLKVERVSAFAPR